jgi:hypothetical protein
MNTTQCQLIGASFGSSVEVGPVPLYKHIQVLPTKLTPSSPFEGEGAILRGKERY